MSTNPLEIARTAVWKHAGLLLRQLRDRHGFSPAQLAARAGVSADLIVAYEAGRERFPEVEAMWRLTTALNVNFLAFLSEAEKRAGASLRGGVTPLSTPLSTPRTESSTEASELDAFLNRLGHDKSAQGG